MTIHRRTTSPRITSSRRHLGRIRVTIDDLKALQDLLAVKNKDITDIATTFDGGRFDDPNDLKYLSDLELRELTIFTPKVQIALSTRRAIAIGDEQACEDVYKLWARTRQTKLRPIDSRTYHGITELSPPVRMIIMATLGLVLGLLPSAAIISSTQSTNPQGSIIPTHPFSLAVVAVTLITCTYVTFLMLKKPANYAVILPTSLDEIRKDTPTHLRHKVTITVAITGVLVASITAILTKILWK